MLKFDAQPTFWAGNLQEHDKYEANLAKALDAYSARTSEVEEEEEDTFEDMYRTENGVGILSISGHLVAGTTGPFFRRYGILGYSDIQEAIALAAQDRTTSKVLLYVNSPGGSVNGLSLTGDMLSALASQKPMVGYADMAASAGYWLFSSAPTLHASDAALLGSIGVVRIHREYSKMEAAAGITTNVLRAGKYKMLLNPYEPLTEEAKAEVSTQLGDLYDSFIGVVADNRGTTITTADQQMGQGREFLGKRAVQAGLVDAISTSFEAISALKASGKVRQRSNFTAAVAALVADGDFVAHNAQHSTHTDLDMKLTPAQIAQLAAGATLEQVTGVAATAAVTEDTAVTGTEGEDNADGSSTTQASAATTEADAADETTAQVEALQTELATANAALAQSQQQAATAASQVADLQASVDGLTTIAAAVVTHLGIVLGRKQDVASMSAADLIAAHTELDASFKATFKPGAVAARIATTETKPVQAVVDTQPKNVHPDFDLNLRLLASQQLSK